MLHDYLRSFWLGVLHNKVSTLINVGGLALGIAWLTVGVLAARAANQKPVLALRYE